MIGQTMKHVIESLPNKGILQSELNENHPKRAEVISKPPKNMGRSKGKKLKNYNEATIYITCNNETFLVALSASHLLLYPIM